MGDLGSALRRSDVEVVILNEAPPLLAHWILSQGKLVFEIRFCPGRVSGEDRKPLLGSCSDV
jgi:hypothetical protein